MSDPDAVIEQTPPPQPPRPTARSGTTPQSQLEADEQYARQLADQYGDGAYGPPRGGSRGRQPERRRSNTSEEYSFIDDDLPVLKENLRKGFLETQSKVTGWFTDLKKKIDGDDDDTPSPPGQYRRTGDGRQSGDYNRYDADPQVLSDDFAGIQLNSDGSKCAPLNQNLSTNHYRHWSSTRSSRCESRSFQAYASNSQRRQRQKGYLPEPS